MAGPFKLGEVTFPNHVFCATGARGFFGEGYWFHRYFRPFGLSWDGTNLAPKTTSWDPEAGYMAVEPDGITPTELFPSCIMPHWSGHVLNAVGLSGPGANDIIEREIWQGLTEPFIPSFMATAKTRGERMVENVNFAMKIRECRKDFHAPFALQLGYGCPSSGLDLGELYEEIPQVLEIMACVEVPLVVNFSPLVPIAVLRRIQNQGICAGFWIANTIPFDFNRLGAMIFGQEVSPLVERGFAAGGLSGPWCLPYTVHKVAEARLNGITLPIVAGNGIQSLQAVYDLQEAKADAIAIGSIAFFPHLLWQMRRIIRVGNRIF